MAYALNTGWIQCPAAVVVLKDITNTITYTLPTVSFAYQLGKGNDVVKILDGTAAPSNIVAGVAVANFRIALGLIPSVTTAAWFNNAFTLNATNTTDNYYQLTVYRFPADASPLNFMGVKFDTWALRAMFDLNGANQMVMQNVTGMSSDPLDGTALALPAAGPLPALTSFAQSTYTTATQVAEVNIGLTRNAVPIPQVNVSGTNANLPYLSGGIIQGVMMGTLSLRQSGIATTVPGINNAETSFTVALGGTGAGVSIAMEMEYVSSGSSVDQGIHYQVNAYKLVSVDGTNAGMIHWTDL